MAHTFKSALLMQQSVRLLLLLYYYYPKPKTKTKPSSPSTCFHQNSVQLPQLWMELLLFVLVPSEGRSFQGKFLSSRVFHVGTGRKTRWAHFWLDGLWPYWFLRGLWQFLARRAERLFAAPAQKVVQQHVEISVLIIIFAALENKQHRRCRLWHHPHSLLLLLLVSYPSLLLLFLWFRLFIWFD